MINLCYGDAYEERWPTRGRSCVMVRSTLGAKALGYPVFVVEFHGRGSEEMKTWWTLTSTNVL